MSVLRRLSEIIQPGLHLKSYAQHDWPQVQSASVAHVAPKFVLHSVGEVVTVGEVVGAFVGAFIGALVGAFVGEAVTGVAVTGVAVTGAAVIGAFVAVVLDS